MKRKRGRPKRIVKTDEILDKILKSDEILKEPDPPSIVTQSSVDTTITVIAGQNSQEQLLTMRRHLKGALMATEKLMEANKFMQIENFLQPFTPKCQKCYNAYKWLDKCVCNIDLKEIS